MFTELDIQPDPALDDAERRYGFILSELKDLPLDYVAKVHLAAALMLGWPDYKQQRNAA